GARGELVDRLQVRLRLLVGRVEVDRLLELEDAPLDRRAGSGRVGRRVHEREDAEQVRGGRSTATIGIGAHDPSERRLRLHPQARPLWAEVEARYLGVRPAEENDGAPEREVVVDCKKPAGGAERE